HSFDPSQRRGIAILKSSPLARVKRRGRSKLLFSKQPAFRSDYQKKNETSSLKAEVSFKVIHFCRALKA
ncbi:MAG TPA: hypothetical protein PK992_20000, partial [Planctomycetaceae bacterium]|nr:hypothetical protein [Planctomycetaceae bacterium]